MQLMSGHSCPQRATAASRFDAVRMGIIYGICLLNAVPSALATGGNLAPVSPFLGDGNGQTGSAAASGPLELRGVMTTSKGTMFAIYEPSKKDASRWVGLNEAGPGYVVREYRIVDGEDRVKVDFQGQRLELMLKKARVTAGAVPRTGPTQPPATTESLAKQGLPGIPTESLLPGEKAKFQMLASQVRVRMARQKQAGEQANPTPTPPSGGR